MRVAIYFGTTSGSTLHVAEMIRDALQPMSVDLLDVATLDDAHSMTDYDLLIWGAPTWGYGDLQDDWEDFIDHLDDVDLSGLPVALFGLGDQYGYGEVFVDAMRILHDKAQARGARILGYWPIDEHYDFEHSLAVIDDHFCGLALDEDNQSEFTDARVATWCRQLQAVVFP
ncbi:flavodoxin [Ectothiorhodospira haloalkaliphila]|uniref:flavodoxin n=1 Tax=Ectothiorhodospira haloalkaliphila TaxID=421628 RepID=UPI001EE8555C|nr:flavodoxin [Ectothiorhodospira haloalkaliphila]MCG5525397.1 flavodoxin [Ectothiorhodospira haloalkaliphila]